MKIERANRRTHTTVQEYRFKEAQLVVRDNPSLPVEMLDHIIISRNGHFSFADEGVL